MKKEYSAFKTTILLYIIVLILPFGFYYVNTSFQTIQKDTQVVHDTSWLSGAIYRLAIDPGQDNNNQNIQNIDATLENISQWVSENAQASLYIGANSLQKDFSTVQKCWEDCKHVYQTHQLKQFKILLLANTNLLDTFSINIEKMVYLREDKIINVFYITFMLIMILMLLSIYFIRLYIQIQMEKHAIYDKDTHLFNQKYFLARLHTALERAKREVSPLSLFFLSVDNFTNEAYNEEKQKHLIQHIGHILGIVTRESDTVCRYDNNHFAVLMSHTTKEDALNLEKRMQKALQEYDFKLVPEPEFSLKTTELEHSETEEAFIERSKN